MDQLKAKLADHRKQLRKSHGKVAHDADDSAETDAHDTLEQALVPHDTAEPVTKPPRRRRTTNAPPEDSCTKNSHEEAAAAARVTKKRLQQHG